MIAKILSSSSGFEGIDYNERKTKNGKGELLDAKNFGILDIKEGKALKKEYIAYFKTFCSSNANIKNKQFHAVISCKGKSHSADELKEIGAQYLEKMGYSNNPYLIYYHSDTRNNHIHVVSTRVDANGKKINDSYENLKSLKSINEIMNLIPANEYKSDLEKIMGYSFSSEAQFRLLFEQIGYKITSKESGYSVIKYGGVQGEISKEEILNKVNSSIFDATRVSQLKAIFEKYRSSRDTTLQWKGAPLPGGVESKKEGKFVSSFSEIMAKKFGVELVFHQKEGKIPYGYTVIDHSNKQVLKGSEIMGLQKLLAKATEQERLTGIKSEVSEMLSAKEGLTNLRNQLLANGYLITDQGEVKQKSESIIVYKIPPPELLQLRYQDRVIEAQAFTVSSAGAQYIVADQYAIRFEDIPLSEGNIERQDQLSARLSSIIQNAANIDEAIHQQKLGVIVLGEEVFIIDKENKIVENVAALLNPLLYDAFLNELYRINYVELTQQEYAEKILDLELDRIDSNAEARTQEYMLAPKQEKYSEGPYQTPGSTREIEQILGSIKDEKSPQKRKRKR